MKKDKGEKSEKKEEKMQQFIEAIGRRKTSSARVRLFLNSEQKGIVVNEKDFKDYFPTFFHQETVLAPLKILNLENPFLISIKVKGGGLNSQAEAIRLGLSRALVKYNPDFKKTLKPAGFLKRDPRERERKKFGLKRARRAPQWQKR